MSTQYNHIFYLLKYFKLFNSGLRKLTDTYR